MPRQPFHAFHATKPLEPGKIKYLSHLPIIEASEGLLLQCKRALDFIVGLPKHKNLGRHSSLSLTNPETQSE